MGPFLLPHSNYLALDPALLWLNAVSDTTIALVYCSTAVALILFAIRRRDLRLGAVPRWFAVLLIVCGSTHVLGVITLWQPIYWVQGLTKGLAAVAAVVAAVMSWPHIPKILRRSGPATGELEREVAERKQVEARVRRANHELEQRVRKRTAELERMNAFLEAEIDTRKMAERALIEANQAALRAKEEADRANFAKSKFLAAASHDLRQPFQALRLFLDVLRVRVVDPAVTVVVDKALQALEGGESLLHALLDISTLQAGTVKPCRERFPLADLLHQIETECRPQALSKGLSLRVVGTAGMVSSDPILLRRLMGNLVANALRYTERGGVLVGCRREGRGLRIEVWDTGLGIPPEAHAEIFEEFTQLGNAERDRSKGLGLGLAIVKRLSQLLGFGISLTSTPGRGSVFRLHLGEQTA
jgi:signal transduction histidine kinase